MKRRQLILYGGLLLAAGVLALSFAGSVREFIILPLAYYVWQLGRFYRAVPQQLYWAALIVAVFYFVVITLYDISLGSESGRKDPPHRGPVESLSRALDQRQRGVYFKWQIANMLAEIAMNILNYQERLLPGRKLLGRTRNLPPEVEKYLDAGVNTTFADYPAPNRFRRSPSTPFDVDLDLVVGYLESELEMDEHDDHHP
jgi:hypothetical protein